MYFDQNELKSAIRKLDETRKTFDCNIARVDSSGSEYDNGVKYGTHGSAFLEVDPSTGSVRCRACQAPHVATATPKTIVVDSKSKKVHRVSV